MTDGGDDEAKRSQTGGDPDTLTHIGGGDARMANVGGRADSRRRAVARGQV